MNLFDSANYPTQEPVQLIAGDRWVWKRTDLGADYPPALYALRYAARLEGLDASEIEIDATESGADYLVEVAKATTGTYTPGRYRWQAYIIRASDSERVTVDDGIFEIVANRDNSSNDPRSHARRMLDSIEIALESFAADTVQSYTITTGTGSRTVTKRDVPHLVTLRDKYRAEVGAEERAANGGGMPKIKFRF